MLPGLRPIPIKERASMVFLEYGLLDVIDGAFVLVDKNGVRTQIPIGGIVCLMLEPGIRVSHAAVALAARVGCLLVFVGEAGVRLYSCGQPGGARGEKILYQAKIALDPDARRRVARKMYEFRFKSPVSEEYSIEQLRGIEGSRVKNLYSSLAQKYGVEWTGRRFDPDDWDYSDVANKCLNSATSCLYGICEAAILAAGYAPAIGFVHSGNARSFVYDIADLFKFETVIPVAFQVAAKHAPEPDRMVRLACRDMFRETRFLQTIIPSIEEMLSAGGFAVPERPKDAQPIAIPDRKGIGDDGHRS